jgi:hypothetical protein
MVNSPVACSGCGIACNVYLQQVCTCSFYVHSEIHDLANHEHEKDIEKLAENLDKRSVIFNNALISLYLSITFLALAGLIGGLVVIWMGNIFYVVVGLSCLGILCLVFASLQLIRESMLTLEVIKQHCSQIAKH